MAATSRHQNELKRKAEKAYNSTENPIEKLRAACLMRGANGIRGLSRLFAIMDDDKNKRLSYEEFRKGINEYGLGFSKDEISVLFKEFDHDGSGSIDFEEFLIKLRPPMSKSRIDLINRAYNKLDKNGDGIITIEDLKGVYIVKNHPKFQNGTWSEDQVLRHFLDTFDTKGQEDGVVSREEFLHYYSSVSASIDNDAYFDLMMRTNWKI